MCLRYMGYGEIWEILKLGYEPIFWWNLGAKKHHAFKLNFATKYHPDPWIFQNSAAYCEVLLN